MKGDQNMSIFHNVVKYRHRRSQIDGIMANGIWIREPEKVKNVFKEHFRCFFKKKGEDHFVFNISSLFTRRLVSSERMLLDKTFYKDELFFAP